MIKATAWNGKDLKGTWEVTLKIDGVRALFVTGQDGDTRDGLWMSRACKPLYNLPPWSMGMPRDCEVYLGNFRDTIRATRTRTLKTTSKCSLNTCRCKKGLGPHQEGPTCPKWEEATPLIAKEHLYSLDPRDDRLEYGHMTNPKAASIREIMEGAVKDGYEGLVLRQKDKASGNERWLKVKPEETHDVLITGAFEGKGKHVGRLGGLITAKGEVGTGFTDQDREDLWDMWTGNGYDGSCLVGTTIEVSCMHFTPDGKFRHPRFIRMRPDKVADQ